MPRYQYREVIVDSPAYYAWLRAGWEVYSVRGSVVQIATMRGLVVD